MQRKKSGRQTFYEIVSCLFSFVVSVLRTIFLKEVSVKNEFIHRLH